MSELKDERFRLLVQSVQDYAIFLIDPQGHVQTWNPGAQRIKGYREEEILGRHISTFYSAEDRAAGRPSRLLLQAQELGRAEDEGWRVRKDGTRFWADVVITRILDAGGALMGFTKITRDLTTRREAQETLRLSEERFRVLVQSVKDHAIFMLDPQGHVATWNAGAERIKGYAPHEIIGRHFSTFFLPEQIAEGLCERELETAARDGVSEQEGWRLRKDGTRFWASVVIEPLRALDGTLMGFAKVTRDLTERRAADLEREQLIQAHESVRLRDEFLSIASHELRTPLTALLLQLQTLLQGATEAQGPLRRRAEGALRSGLRLTSLMDTLLDVSRIATGKFTLERTPIDLGELLQEVQERYQEHAEQQRCMLSLSIERPVHGTWDRTRLEQVVTNLLANAFKYAAGAPVDLVARQEGPVVVIDVLDHGPGVHPTDLARIFERFERATSTRHFGGLGLGLYVARQICEAHGGTLTHLPVDPHGACFRATLPVQPPDAALH